MLMHRFVLASNQQEVGGGQLSIWPTAAKLEPRPENSINVGKTRLLALTCSSATWRLVLKGLHKSAMMSSGFAVIAAVFELLLADEKVLSTIYHSDCGGGGGGGGLDVSEGKRTKQKQTRTPRWDSNSPRRIRHCMSCGIKAGTASQRGEERRKSSASRKTLSETTGTSVSLVCFALQRLIFLSCVFYFPDDTKYLREQGQETNFCPQSLPPPSLAAEPDS